MIHLVYIAGPFSAPTREGVEENIRRATEAGIEVARLGLFPVIPHANTGHPEFERVQNYEFWCEGTMMLLEKCHAILMLPGWEKSRGSRAELRFAQFRRMPIYLSLDVLRDVIEYAELREKKDRDGR